MELRVRLGIRVGVGKESGEGKEVKGGALTLALGNNCIEARGGKQLHSLITFLCTYNNNNNNSNIASWIILDSIISSIIQPSITRVSRDRTMSRWNRAGTDRFTPVL